MTDRINLPAFPTGWYRVAASGDVAPGQLVPLRYFGEDLICYRGDDAEVHVLEAHCAHLGANIGRGGHVKGNDVVCPFHHWQYDGEGRNVCVPYRDRPQRAARLRAWPTIERNGLVYAWHAPDGADPDWEPPTLPEFEDPGMLRIEGEEEWTIRSHPQEICENTVDIAHFQYVHGVSGFGSVELVDDGPMLRSVASVTMTTPRGPVEGAIESELWGLGVDLVRQRGIGEAATIFSISPIDAGLLRAGYTFFVPRGRDRDGPSGYGRGLMREFNRQITQDIPIWEHKVYRDRPKLAMGEGAIVDFRRWAEQFYATAASA